MKIGVIGTGYVGLVSSVCLADIGHSLVSIDKSSKVIDTLSQGKATIFEKDMHTMLRSMLAKKSIHFSTDYKDLQDCEVIFLSVGTPPLPNGHTDLSQIFDVIDNLMPVITPDTMITVRSTVPVGTLEKIHNYFVKKGNSNQLIGFCPEFLREGVAITDFLNPQYLVFASNQSRGCEILQKVYAPIIKKNPDIKIINTRSFETAELIKYTVNSFLATKVAFINQIAHLAMSAHADMKKIVEIVGTDKRVGNLFLKPGPGFGGSCLPKDITALVQNGIEYGVDMSIVHEVYNANIRHQEYIASWILETVQQTSSFDGKTIAVWGLTFKSETDDIRSSAAITIIRDFFQYNLQVRAYDPKGIDNFSKLVNGPQISFHDSPLTAAHGADILVVLTDWPEFSSIHATTVHAKMNGDTPYVFDTRNVLSIHAYKDAGFRAHKFGI